MHYVSLFIPISEVPTQSCIYIIFCTYNETLFDFTIFINGICEKLNYEDKMDIHINPKISADWGFRSKQRLIPTPGRNDRYNLAAAPHTKTEQVSYVGSSSNALSYL